MLIVLIFLFVYKKCDQSTDLTNVVDKHYQEEVEQCEVEPKKIEEMNEHVADVYDPQQFKNLTPPKSSGIDVIMPNKFNSMTENINGQVSSILFPLKKWKHIKISPLGAWSERNL